MSLAHLSLIQALSLWSDLVDAQYGEASHGSDAEIYAYRLCASDPGAEAARHTREPPVAGALRDARDAQCRQAAKSLVSLVEHFARVRDVRVDIDGIPPQAWLDEIGDGFGHRTLVRVYGGSR